MNTSRRLVPQMLALFILASGQLAGQVRTGEIRRPPRKLQCWNLELPEAHLAARSGPFLRRHAEDQLLVRFKATATTQDIQGTLELHHVRTIKKLTKVDVYQVQVPVDSTLEETLSSLESNPYVESVQPNPIARICATPNDTYFGFQYALYNSGQSVGPPGSPQGTSLADIKATAAWEETTGSSDIVIAVIDTGVDLLHPDLVNKIVSPGRDFVNDDYDATDDNGHGTFVAGIAAAETNNNEGIAGVAWNCLILPVKVMDEYGDGYYSDMIEGIIWAVDNGAHIINLSIGGPESSSALEDAVSYAYANDVVVVCSAGNDAEPVYFPAAYDDYVLAVAATDYNDARVEWSNYGPELDVAAPGEWIISCLPTWYFGSGSIPYAYGDGTSFACAYVSGFAALIKSLKDWMSAGDIMDVIRFSSDDVNESDYPDRDDYLGYGRINMETALVPIKLK